MRTLRVTALALLLLSAWGPAARAAGAYASAPAADAVACARRCDQEGLCVAWGYGADGACELRATIPADPTGRYGLSSRAPPALRAALSAQPPPIAVTEAPRPAPAATDAVSAQLLGGLEEDSMGLRH